jgi:Xaa-Pro aminopeptidase
MRRFLAALALLLPVLAFAQEAKPFLPVIPPTEFAARRLELQAKFPATLLLLEADPLAAGMDNIDENTPVYDFFYLTGHHRVKDILALGPRPKSEILFTDEKPEEVKAKSGISDVRPVAAFDEYLKGAVGKSGPIATRLREEAKEKVTKAAEKAGVEVESAGKKIWETITRLRMIKSRAELDMMRKAADATNKAHLEAMKACKPGMNEKELQRVIEDKFKAEGCDGLGFPSIVGSGKNGTILHYNDNTMEMPKDTLVVCDIGASYRGYVTDITRTLPTGGKFGPEHRVAYQAVLDAQKAAEQILRPGVSFGQLHAAAAKVFKDRKLEDWCYCHSKSGGPRHGLSHYVGLAVHDSGVYQMKMQAGMIITIEPGYYNKEGKYGIRIEDIYIVTAEGFERMSAGAPREIAEIEKLMGKKEY